MSLIPTQPKFVENEYPRPLLRRLCDPFHRALHAWRLWQFRRSRWFIFWTLKETIAHYRLWRIRAEIMKHPRSLMHEGKQIYRYAFNSHGQAILVGLDTLSDAEVDNCERTPTEVDTDYWKRQEIGLQFSPELAQRLYDQGVRAGRKSGE